MLRAELGLVCSHFYKRDIGHQADPDLGGSQGGGHTAPLLLMRFHFHHWSSYCGVSLWKRIGTGRKCHTAVYILETKVTKSLKLQEFEF